MNFKGYAAFYLFTHQLMVPQVLAEKVLESNLNDLLFGLLSVIGTVCIYLEIFLIYEKDKKKQHGA